MNLIEIILAQGSWIQSAVAFGPACCQRTCHFLKGQTAMADADVHAASDAMAKQVLAFIAANSGDEPAFDDLALRLFGYQFANNPPFQQFCQARGITPRRIKGWRDIPAVPINAFKDFRLSCLPLSNPADRTGSPRVFMTSGTTRPEQKGQHHHPSLEVYDASMQHHFAACFMGGHTRLRMGVLFPTEAQLPHSSLAHYLALALQHFGAPGSRYYVDAQGLQIDTLCADLAHAQAQGEPLALLGASFSWVHALDALQQRGLSFSLPPGSRVLDTGGFKGQSRELSMDAFYGQLSTTLGVPLHLCINMYGMTELSSQCYDSGNAQQPARKRGPRWICTRVLDPLSGQELAPGQIGLLAHTDLANFNSVTTILTEDLGFAQDDGFVLLGRVQGASAKGCSLAMQQFLQAAGGAA